jgi:hypothetical protein
MRLLKLLLLLIAILILHVIFASMGQSASKVQFSIIYSNDVMGEVEPCG